MQTRTRTALILSVIGLAFALGPAVQPALAQGKKGGNGSAVPPGHAKKKVTSAQAVVAVREVLVVHGYNVVRVEQVGVTQVIHYRRGNNGRGRGLGPVQKMVIRPSGDVVVFDSAPPKVLVDVRARLGL